MRYDDPATQQALAAEYVMGLLKGAARRRFERLMAARPEWREEVELWSTRLAGLATTVKPQEPPPSVWAKIVGRIEPSRAATPSRALRWWQALAAVTSVAALALAVTLMAPRPEPSIAPQVSVLKDAEARTGWVVTVRATIPTAAQIRVAVESPRAIPDKAYELWALPGGTSAPISLGLLPTAGEATLTVRPDLVPVLQRGAGLAVSVEPPGGSPTGQPTGPVLYQGKLTAI